MTAKRPPTTGPRCGTYAGYHHHRERGERPCLPCYDAHNTYQRDRRQTQRDVILAAQRRAILAEAVGTGSYGGRA